MRRLYVIAGTAMLVVIGLITYDQLVVGPDGNGTYLLGKATPAVVWVLTLITPIALIDFFMWLRRTRGNTSVFWWATGSVVAAFLLGLYLTSHWSIEWLVEKDIEVRFASDSFLPLAVGLWSAWLAAAVVVLVAGSPRRSMNENLRVSR